MKNSTSPFVVVLGLLCIAASSSSGDKVAGPIRAHVVAHTHDDVGWLKTVDQYYYGSESSIQNAGVQYIIDNVIVELTRNPNRKFIYVEMAFFFRWWREQTDDTKKIVRGLVSNGQLEFINGGWTMHDEATTLYEEIIDQMTLGHRFLLKEFGVVPKIGWQVDPFGHSSTSAIIDAEIGFEALFFARMDYQDYNFRVPQKALEMVWKPSASIPTTQLLTGMLFGNISGSTYCTPRQSMYEVRGIEPVMDDPLLEDYNLVRKADEFVLSLKNHTAAMRHNEVMLPWGCDFTFQNAELVYKNIEKLMTYVNANSAKYNVSMFYSTPSLYAEAIIKANKDWPTKLDDFMPYGNNGHSYWTGYFTSRPALKGYVRYSNNLLQATTQLYSSSGIQNDTLKQQIFQFQEPVAVLSHHDAVSGTEKQQVANNYALRLSVGTASAQDVISKIISYNIGGKQSAPTFTFCPLLNESICPSTAPLTNKQTVVVVVYNPLAWPRSEYVTLPVPVSTVSVLDGSGKSIKAQISTPTPNNSFVTFVATVTPLGFATYFLQQGSSIFSTSVSMRPLAGPITLENQFLSVKLDEYGKFVSVTNKVSQKTVGLTQNYLYYVSSTGTPDSGQCSGAYIFRPASDIPTPYSTLAPSVIYTNGSLVSEVVRVFGPTLSQIIRLYADKPHIEVVDIVGPIDVSDGKGKEVISRYVTDLSTQNTFYADSNGIEILPRTLNYRPTWPYQVIEAVAGNYYPVNAIAYIKDNSTKDAQFTVLTDRSRGGSSLSNGQLEVMLHRATTKDDVRGVGEPLNERNQVAATSWLVVDSATASSSTYRSAAKRLAHPFVLGFASTSSVATWKGQYKTDFVPITTQIPNNVQLLTFAPTENQNEYILRFHHIYQVGEDKTLSVPVTFDVNAIFSAKISVITETQLTSVRKSSRSDAVNYRSDSVLDPTLNAQKREQMGFAPIPITLAPTEIRTFIVKF